jgi:cobyric acid synthase
MSANEVTVIDYGMGNLLSVQRGLEHCGANVTLTADPEQILDAKRVVLPGVGAFGNAMQALEQLSLVAVIRELAHRQTPLLGICLGMQLLLDESEEFGITGGLGLIPGRVIPVPAQTVSGETQKILAGAHCVRRLYQWIGTEPCYKITVQVKPRILCTPSWLFPQTLRIALPIVCMGVI